MLRNLPLELPRGKRAPTVATRRFSYRESSDKPSSLPSMPGSGDVADGLTRRAATASVWPASVSATTRETPDADEVQAAGPAAARRSHPPDRAGVTSASAEMTVPRPQQASRNRGGRVSEVL